MSPVTGTDDKVPTVPGTDDKVPTVPGTDDKRNKKLKFLTLYSPQLRTSSDFDFELLLLLHLTLLLLEKTRFT